jgi:hypothetical protein
MIRLRRWSALAVVLLLTPAALGQEKGKWYVDRTLTVTPQAAPVPLFAYRLLPSSSELKEGNAVPIYDRLVHEQSDAARKYWAEAPVPWNKMPVDKIPLGEADKFLKRWGKTLQQLEYGARRRSADWNYTVEQDDILGMLLPDAQTMRSYVPMLILQVRVALARADFKAAAHHLETCFAISRQMAEGPSFVNGLVGVALASQFADPVADFIEQPDAPNLYWAMTALPRPLIELRKEAEFDHGVLEMTFRELKDLDRERTAEQWDATWRKVRAGIKRIGPITMEGKPPKYPDWFPKDFDPDQPAADSPELSAARDYVVRTRKLSADKVQALPAGQVLLMYVVGIYSGYRDELFAGAYLPFLEGKKQAELAFQRLVAAPISTGTLLGRMLLPGIHKVFRANNRLERHLAALRVVEALRMYAAAHDGRLPEKLSDITEVPVPENAGTGQPFEYHLDGDTGILVSQVPGETDSMQGIRYRISVRKK